MRDREANGAAIPTIALTRDPDCDVARRLRTDGSCWYYGYGGVRRLTNAEWESSGGSSLYAFAYPHDTAGNRSPQVVAASGSLAVHRAFRCTRQASRLSLR